MIFGGILLLITTNTPAADAEDLIIDGRSNATEASPSERDFSASEIRYYYTFK